MLKQQFEEKPRGVLLRNRIAVALSAALSTMAKRTDVEWLNPIPPGRSEEIMTPPNAVFKTSGAAFLANPELSEEMFGPATLLVVCDDAEQMIRIAKGMAGNLTATLHATAADSRAGALLAILEQKVGRVVFNGYPTGVEVCPSMQHGGPYPAAAVASSTSVGTDAINRFARFVAYQAVPDELLPDALKNGNPWGIHRKINGKLTRDSV